MSITSDAPFNTGPEELGGSEGEVTEQEVDGGSAVDKFSSDNAPATRLGKVVRLVGSLAIVGAAGVLGGWPLLLMVGAFVVSILLHEAGHFFVARRAGMKATEFFVGFGPKIFSFKRKETEYGLKVIPAGAYVRIIGMSNLEKVEPEDESRTFRSKPFRWRFATVVAGPAANLLLALVLLLGVNLFSMQRDTSAWSAEQFLPSSTAEDINIQFGEKVVSINGEELSDYDAFVESVRSNPNDEAIFVIEAADGTTREATANIGWRVGPEGQELLAPLAENDVVLQADGTPMLSFEDFAAKVNDIPAGEAVSVQFLRAGGVFETDLGTPSRPVAINDTVGYFGVVPQFGESRLPPGEAVTSSFSLAGKMVVGSVKSIADFFSPSGLASFGSTVLSGSQAPEPQTDISVIFPAPSGGGVAQADQERILSVVGVVRLGTQAAESSLPAFLSIWILINIFLAVINMLPLLPFDGGHAVVATWEKIRGVITRKPDYRVDIAKLIPFSYAVILVFVVVGVSAMWLDITSPVQNPFS